MPYEALPSVKCSSCGQPVPLANLSDHVCAPPNIQKPPLSPMPAPALLPQRLQSLTAPPHRSSPEKPSREDERSLAPSDPFQRFPSDKSSTATPKATNVPFPKNSPTFSSLPLDRDRPQLPGTPIPPHPPPERISTPVRDPIPPAFQRARIPSNASRIAPISPARAAFPSQTGEPSGNPIPQRPIPPSSALGGKTPPPTQQPWAPLQSPFPDRVSSNAIPPPHIRPRPSFEYARTSPTILNSRPSVETPHSSRDKLRPSLDARRPSASVGQNPPTTSSPRPPRTPVLPFAPGSIPFPSSAPVLSPPMSARQPPPPPLSLPYSHFMDREIDTKIGGEAGMAGVGRRGFEAAARAALLAASRSHQHAHATALGDSPRVNVPQYLDTNTTLDHVMRAAKTPPLSPNSVQTPSPVSPFPVSPVSLGNIAHANGQYPNLPSSHNAIPPQSRPPTSNDKALSLSFSPSGVRIASPSRSPSPIPNPFERRLSGETITQSPLPGANMPLSFFDALKPEVDFGNESDDESVYTTHTDVKREPLSPSAGSDVGLAYAQDSDDDTPVVMPLDIRKSTLKQGVNKVKFPTSASPNPSGPSRQTSVPSLRSVTSSRSVTTSLANPTRTRSVSSATQSTVRSVGALERAMETLIEEGASVSVLASGSVLASIGGPASGRSPGKPSRSNTVPGPASPEQKPPKLPARSHTNPSHPHIHPERVGLTGEVVRIRNGSVKRQNRVCARCNSKIEDGRWIQMDGGSVLCERCWKNMYLPKCRRCNLPIEKQAVSSRDGQLKGKYHKECFSCHTCQKPFPDKEFYVLDGKPFCAYHYHEANNSLCGAASCGQPIEGPCAVTHSGRRFHPEHLLCEFEDGCKEKLEEYWEVDGQMLCERHATFIGCRDSGWTRDNDPVGDTQVGKALGTDEGRMMKRMTRFIDLGAGGDDELDIR